MPSSLASLSELSTSSDLLSAFLVLLLEVTPPTRDRLTDALLSRFASRPPASREDILRAGEEETARWTDWDLRVGFVEGHPRIGEGDVLSELSKREQGLLSGAPPTTQATLDRLRELNVTYERCFPRLRYITFVNGRPRSAIVPEMEAVVGADEHVREVGTSAWEAECDRAVKDVWLIGHARLQGMLKG